MEEPRTTSAPLAGATGAPWAWPGGAKRPRTSSAPGKSCFGLLPPVPGGPGGGPPLRRAGHGAHLTGPDQLSDMTDTITAGIAPDQAMLEAVTDTAPRGGGGASCAPPLAGQEPGVSGGAGQPPPEEGASSPPGCWRPSSPR